MTMLAGAGQALPRSMFRKIWDQHVVVARESGPSLLYIDRHMVHEGSFHAFGEMQRRGLEMHSPDQVFGAADHYAPTVGRRKEDAATPEIGSMLDLFDANMRRGGVRHFGLAHPRQGIVHVIGPELGITLPGLTIVCSDSHTSTQGAFGSIAFGVGQSESLHVLATQTLWQSLPKTMRITVDGVLPEGVHAKDIILAIIGKIGAGGATGHAIEYAGSTIRSLSIEGRLTVCNMSIEAAARSGMIAPDETVFDYVHGRPFAPTEHQWDEAVAKWRQLPTDPGAHFDNEVQLNASEITPMVTWGTSPEEVLQISGLTPDPTKEGNSDKRKNMERALDYMGLKPGQPLEGLPVDRVFIGSCTNGRIEDIRVAAKYLVGRKTKIPAIVVPGSMAVKRQAEAEGLDRVFTDAGFEWRDSGCSMCSAMNGDIGQPGERCVSTSNRNFVGRQGLNVRTHLASPLTAVAAAVNGTLVDVRRETDAKRVV